jgi:hypothetical protein
MSQQESVLLPFLSFPFSSPFSSSSSSSASPLPSAACEKVFDFR